jgi:hypothetical protein
MPAEENHEIGREGVFLFKRWLEATTYLDLPWHAYGSAAHCEVHHMGGIKTYDLAGMFLIEGMPPVVVECKRYGSVGAQAAEFEQFLAIAYGTVLWEKSQNMRPKNRHFIWATTHPFAQSAWPNLTSVAKIQEAVAKYPEFVGNDPFNQELGHSLAERVWLLVLSEKQERIMLTPGELMTVWKKLKRKEVTA